MLTDNYRDIIKFILFILLIQACYSCDIPEENTSDDKSKVSKRPDHLTAWALGADQKNISDSDLRALSSLDTLASKWNDIAAIIIRDYQDPHVSAYKWIDDTRYNIAELRKIHMLMNSNLISMQDKNLKKSIDKIVENYRSKLDALVLLHNAVAMGDVEAYKEATEQIAKASEEGRKFALEYFDKIRTYVHPDSLKSDLQKRAERIADKMKPQRN